MKIRKFFRYVLLILAVGGLIMTGVRLFTLVRGPSEVRRMRREEIVQKEEGYLEYYFSLLSEDEKRGYRELLSGVRSRKEKFYLTISGDSQVDRVYHAVLKDHPEIFWIHNRKQVYKTVYAGGNYCQFSPEYSYNEEEAELIIDSMEQAYQDVLSLVPEGAEIMKKCRQSILILLTTRIMFLPKMTRVLRVFSGRKGLSVQDMQELFSTFWSGLVYPVFM